jgi:glutathione S-transferase
MTIELYELAGENPARPFSPHCWKVVMALAHKGLDFERHPVGFTEIKMIGGGSHRTVPVIADNGTVIGDSFMIATYLEQAYLDHPTLFGGDGGKTMARLIEAWSAQTIHPYIGQAILTDIFRMLGPDDQAYFRQSREARYGKSLESVPAGREEKDAAFLIDIEPLRLMLKVQNFIGGDGPLFADYIIFGAFQWARICSPFEILPKGDTVRDWFERCLDLHDGLGRSVPAAS